MKKTAKLVESTSWELNPPVLYVDLDGNLKGVTPYIYLLFSAPAIRARAMDTYGLVTVGYVPELEPLWQAWVHNNGGHYPRNSFKVECDFLRHLGYEVVE